MFSKSAILFATMAAMTGFTSAASTECCNTISNTGSPSTAKLLSLLGIVVQGANVPIGLDCSPISVIGVGGTTCETNTVTCSKTAERGLIGIDCVPVNVAA